jgi:hypothetical protein
VDVNKCAGLFRITRDYLKFRLKTVCYVLGKKHSLNSFPRLECGARNAIELQMGFLMEGGSANASSSHLYFRRPMLWKDVLCSQDT